jgi:hypothetical protein
MVLEFRKSKTVGLHLAGPSGYIIPWRKGKGRARKTARGKLLT